ncbi:translation initiation factor IF-2 [Nocardiopsis gilva YIM 90087]|uniref:Translation initiation factor IF-2 n=1 Tax=Nocardiopsis gilva YIM 90087 TaxID=1235441 RepID=A0A223S8H2_9ACTN|nr:SAM-dependent methyltransferase [Nocardiopsis gilva]ASU84417.1 translation initiation factor IF-2 [Nocardiopsis gilva YIM 90087]
MSDTPDLPPQIDTSVPHSARFWDCLLGGKDNFAADREAVEQALQLQPDLREVARADRAFLSRAVRILAGEAGIRQFLDIGTGLPTVDHTHTVAQGIAPESRIVYVDNDPIVLLHAQALLVGTEEGSTEYIDADARDVDRILAKAADTIDFEQPVAVMMLGILNFILDDEEAHAVVDRLLGAVPGGSYLVLAHPTAEVGGPKTEEAIRQLNETSATPQKLRSPEALATFMNGLDILEPGIVSCSQWRTDADSVKVLQYCAVGRKA